MTIGGGQVGAEGLEKLLERGDLQKLLEQVERLMAPGHVVQGEKGGPKPEDEIRIRTPKPRKGEAVKGQAAGGQADTEER